MITSLKKCPDFARQKRTSQLFSGLLLLSSYSAFAKDQPTIDEMMTFTLEQLLSLKITSASDFEQTLRNSPNSIQVVTQEQIQQRGYNNLGQILSDLPGFDNIVSYGHDYTTSYQRGYRTPSTQRTLFMVNGIVNNLLWSQEFPVNHQIPLSNVERIEVLYGPAGAVYGANAFLGVVNIITQNTDELDIGESYFDSNIHTGSFSTLSVDMAAAGRQENFGYSFSAKWHQSDGPKLNNFSDWGFNTTDYLNNEQIWGPVLEHQNQNTAYGEYLSKDKEKGIIGEVYFDNVTLGLNHWSTQNGYGLKLTFDKGQPNADWAKKTNIWYLKYEKQINDQLFLKTLIKQRNDRRWGNWAEASDDWNANMENYSYVSISNWNSINKSQKFRQDLRYQFSPSFMLSAGIKYESKSLTKSYDICGYWSSAFCSSSDGLDLGPYGFGQGVYHSSDDVLPEIVGNLNHMPSSNLVSTSDKGIYFQGNWDFENWLYSIALRWDNNSIYGDFVKPRLSAIHHLTSSNTIKLVYSTAYQEPAPLQLYGGWNGRKANPELKPEETANLEFIWLYQHNNFLHDFSIYQTNFENVIKEEAENAGERQVNGFEYRGRYEFENTLADSANINVFLNYTYSQVTSNVIYDFQTAQWVGSGIESCSSGDLSATDPVCRSVDSNLGDIAPHKLNFGVNWPLSDKINLNLRANYVSERELYLRNPLRNEDFKIDDYWLVNSHLNFKFDAFSIGLSINNLFDTSYFHPGLAQANSGMEFNDAQGNPLRSQGFNNSLIPQLERNYSVTFSTSF